MIPILLKSVIPIIDEASRAFVRECGLVDYRQVVLAGFQKITVRGQNEQEEDNQRDP